MKKNGATPPSKNSPPPAPQALALPQAEPVPLLPELLHFAFLSARMLFLLPDLSAQIQVHHPMQCPEIPAVQSHFPPPPKPEEPPPHNCRQSQLSRQQS
jgi:hypothetical protein